MNSMKKIILFIIIAFFLSHIKSYSQAYRELKTEIELSRLVVKNKKLEKGLGLELLNNNNKEWSSNSVYLLSINGDRKQESYKLTVTLSTICDVCSQENIGFFEIHNYTFVVRDTIQSNLYSVTSEKKIFKCIKYYKENDGMLEPVLPIRWEPPIWIYSLKKNRLRCIEKKIFN